MRSLQDWVDQLLSEDIREVNRKYLPGSSRTIEKEIESLPDVDPMKYGQNRVDANILQKMHFKIRQQKCETEIWSAIIFHLAEPLTTPIAHDLIDRDIIVNELGHTRQNDEIQWRLASLIDEALLTLFRDLYIKPNYKLEALQTLLRKHPNHRLLLDKWEYWADESSTTEKEIAFHQWAWQHPSRPADFPSPEEYLEVMANRERRKVEDQRRIEHEEKQERLRIEREAKARRLDLTRIANTLLDQTEIDFILLSQEPDMLWALASNTQIEVQWVQKLVNCHHVKGARQIREAASGNLEARQS